MSDGEGLDNMPNGTGMVGLAAPARRVGLFLGDEGVDDYVVTADGLALFEATVYWFTGRTAAIDTPASRPEGAFHQTRRGEA
jgi:hypothetical protein